MNLTTRSWSARLSMHIGRQEAKFSVTSASWCVHCSGTDLIRRLCRVLCLSSGCMINNRNVGDPVSVMLLLGLSNHSRCSIWTWVLYPRDSRSLFLSMKASCEQIVAKIRHHTSLSEPPSCTCCSSSRGKSAEQLRGASRTMPLPGTPQRWTQVRQRALQQEASNRVQRTSMLPRHKLRQP